MISPRVFVERIWEYAPDKIIELTEELQKSLEVGGYSELEAIVLAEKTMPRVKTFVSEKILYYERKNITPNFRFSETSPNRLVGILVSEKDGQMRLRLLHRKGLHTMINNLSWERFEDLCVYTLKLCGFKKYQVGERTKDGGLDFFGVCPWQDLSGYKGFMTNINVRVFGQAKHRRKSSVTGDDVRVFQTHFEEFKDEKGEAYNFVTSKCKWFLEAQGPLMPMIMTNRSFTKGAESFAENRKIILREGPQIVEDIVRLAELETWLTREGGEYSFKPRRFESYLDTMSGEGHTQ